MCIKESVTYCLSVPLFVQFSFFPINKTFMASDGYHQGNVSFTHCLLYLMTVTSANMITATAASLTTATAASFITATALTLKTATAFTTATASTNTTATAAIFTIAIAASLINATATKNFPILYQTKHHCIQSLSSVVKRCKVAKSGAKLC